MIKKLFSFISIILISNILTASIFTTNFSDNTPPTIFNFRIDASSPNRVYFDSSEPIKSSNVNGFVISNKTISDITINDGQLSNHYITVSSSFTFWDNNTIRYEGGSDLRDTDNNQLIEFTLSYIKNEISEPTATKNRYVTTSAKGGADGTTENTAWTLKEAFSKANAGITVWIKAGNYGNQNLAIYNDGTATSPIKFIGYKNSIRDISSNYYDYDKKWDSSEMPTLTGKSASKGHAIQLMGTNYVVFRNLQIANYYMGIRANNTLNSNLVFDRINGKLFGNNSPSANDVNGSFINFQTLIAGKNKYRPFTSNNNMKVLDCRSVNANMHGFYLFGDGRNLIEGCKSYNDRTGAYERQDYHISVNGHNNIMRHCYAENFNTTRTNMSTHGIGIRGNSNLSNTYNLIEKSEGVNVTEPFYIRNFGCDYNVIKDCIAGNNSNASNYLKNENSGAVWIWGGSNYNIIERVISNNTTFGIGFKDNQEEGNTNDTSIGHDNIIRNCVFNKTKYSIYTQGSYNGANSLLKDNKIINCTFNNGQVIFKNYNTNVQNLEIINCSFSNFTGSKKYMLARGDLKFSYSNFFKLSGNWMPNSGISNISVNPKFLSSTDFHLTTYSSDKITEGGDTQPLVQYDFDNKFRNAPYSIGAYEYGDNTTGLINANAGEDTEICKGDEIILNATGNGEFLWNTGETTASIKVSPEETTTYTVTVSDGENSESDEVVITVNELPTVVLGEDIDSCPGSEVILTAQGIGNFLWSTGETTASISVSPMETTAYSVIASNGCDVTATDEIIVNIIAGTTVNAGEDISICLGTEVTLTAEGNGNYLWNTGETTASILVSPIETTTYSVTSTSENCSVTDEVIVTITALPEVSLGDDISICSGQETILTAEGVGIFLWNTGETSKSITINPKETTTYTVVASSTCNNEVLTASDEIIVDVTPNVILDAGEDATICKGNTVSLTATGNSEFLWSTGETTASITVNPIETTIYTVTSGVGNCTVTDEVTVTVDDLPSVNLGGDLTICSGQEITLTVEGSGDFLWSTGETGSSITVNPIETTTYSVTASSLCTSDVTDEIIVSVSPEIILDAGNDVTICSGELVVLTATGNNNFLWNTGETTASISVNPSETTTYTVTSGSGNCAVTDEVIVTVDQLPTVDLGNDISICYGDETILTSQGTGNFLWSTGETTSSIRINPTETTTYTVTASNFCNVEVMDEIIVNVGPQIMVDAGEDKTVCIGESVTLTATGNGSFLWNTGETTASITVSPDLPTTYSVTSSIGSCSVFDEVMVMVDYQPSVDLGEDVSICPGESVTLVAEGIGNFLWNTGEITSSILVNPTETTTYTVTASSSCSEGVTDEIVVTVTDPIFADAGDSVVIEQGQSIQLTATGGNKFLWNTGETSASIMVQPTQTTTYSVEVSNEGFSCSNTDTVEVGVVSNFNADSATIIGPLIINSGVPEITICSGDEITLIAHSSALHYLWNTKEMSSSIKVRPTKTTTYHVSALINSILETTNVTIKVQNCSINKKDEFNIYPNPTQGVVNIHLPSQKTKLKLSLFSLQGKLVYNKEVKADRNGIFTQIDLSSMAKGVYLLYMSNDNFNETKKILVI